MRAVDLSQDKAFELTELANLNLLAGHPDKAIDILKPLWPSNLIMRLHGKAL